MGSSFESVIKEHLELRRRNARLESRLPLDRYRTEETTNHSLFRAEAEARETEPDVFVPDWSAREARETALESWLVRDPPSFDWGD
jgi:hypothetical protein